MSTFGYVLFHQKNYVHHSHSIITLLSRNMTCTNSKVKWFYFIYYFFCFLFACCCFILQCMAFDKQSTKTLTSSDANNRRWPIIYLPYKQGGPRVFPLADEIIGIRLFRNGLWGKMRHEMNSVSGYSGSSGGSLLASWLAVGPICKTNYHRIDGGTCMNWLSWLADFAFFFIFHFSLFSFGKCDYQNLIENK